MKAWWLESGIGANVDGGGISNLQTAEHNMMVVVLVMLVLVMMMMMPLVQYPPY